MFVLTDNGVDGIPRNVDPQGPASNRRARDRAPSRMAESCSASSRRTGKSQVSSTSRPMRIRRIRCMIGLGAGFAGHVRWPRLSV